MNTSSDANDDLLERRRRRGDHRERLDYDDLVQLLEDADRVVDDLKHSKHVLLVPADEIEFTVRRLHVLLRGAIASARGFG